MTKFSNPHDALKHHVSGAIARGEKVAITAEDSAALRWQVTRWLEALPHIINAKPVTVRIGRETFEGAEYEAVGRYESSMTGVQSGEHKAGEEYTNRYIYLVGTLPASYRSRKATCYNFAGDSRDWYVCCYMDAANLKPQFVPFHPFGQTFMLAPWEVPDGTAIDRYESKPYTRVAAVKTESGK